MDHFEAVDQAMLNAYYDGQLSDTIVPAAAPEFHSRLAKERNGQLTLNIRFYVALVPSLYERYSKTYVDRIEGIRRSRPRSHRDLSPAFF